MIINLPPKPRLHRGGTRGLQSLGGVLDKVEPEDDNPVVSGIPSDVTDSDASVEFGTQLPWFEDLFTDTERYEARTRLITHDFAVDARIRSAVADRPDWTWRV